MSKEVKGETVCPFKKVSKALDEHTSVGGAAPTHIRANLETLKKLMDAMPDTEEEPCGDLIPLRADGMSNGVYELLTLNVQIRC